MSFLRIAQIEGHFFRRYPRLLLAAAVVALIPALYVLIYLSSVWDPAAKTGALPVAIVNLDQGLEYRQHAFNVGRDLDSGAALAGIFAAAMACFVGHWRFVKSSLLRPSLDL